MRVLRHVEELAELAGPLFVSVGTFDGVHCGHRRVLAELVRLAESRGGQAVAVTFEPHPAVVVRPVAAPLLLTTLAEKRREIERVGVHALLCLEFNLAMSQREGGEFLRALLGPRERAGGLVAGHDTHLGRDRSMGAAEIAALAASEGWELRVVPAEVVDGLPVSSTRVRELLLRGQVGPASCLLGRPYSLAGCVVRGDGRGRQLGYPTANLGPLEDRKLLPGDGIYAGWVERGQEGFRAALCIGRRPTFGEGPRTVEAHLLDFHGDLLGESLRVHWVARLRDEERFASVEALQVAMAQDCRRAAELLGERPRLEATGVFP